MNTLEFNKFPFTVALLLSCLPFFHLETCATEISAPTNGIYIAIAAERPGLGIVTTNIIGPNDALLFMPFCDTGHVEVLYPLDPAFGVKITMTDASGRDVSKTQLGKVFGAKFDKLRSVTDTRCYPFTAGGSYTNNEGLGGARFFYNRPSGERRSHVAPADLFQLEYPGVYTLEVQMQMFRFASRSTNKWQRDLFRFPPVKLKIEKPPINN